MNSIPYDAFPISRCLSTSINCHSKYKILKMNLNIHSNFTSQKFGIHFKGDAAAAKGDDADADCAGMDPATRVAWAAMPHTLVEFVDADTGVAVFTRRAGSATNGGADDAAGSDGAGVNVGGSGGAVIGSNDVGGESDYGVGTDIVFGAEMAGRRIHFVIVNRDFEGLRQKVEEEAKKDEPVWQRDLADLAERRDEPKPLGWDWPVQRWLDWFRSGH
jgi:hypothetical protein